MSSQNIDILLENQSLKNEFAIRNLDLSQVFCPTPDNMERDNRFLRHLLDWVDKYKMCGGDRKRMEAEGYQFPPLDFDIDPESDWYRFERWIKGLPIRKKIKDQLPPFYTPKNPENLTDEEILAELETLKEHLFNIHISIDLIDDVPPRLVYLHLLEELEETFDLINEGFWHLDGCSGCCCPGCFQRPWCEFGSSSCWPEDEEAGKMHLIDAVKQYVSPTPISLQILQNLQAEEDKNFEESKKKQGDSDIKNDPLPFDFSDDDDDLPF